MATPLGQSARYVSQEATRKLRRIAIVALCTGCVLSLVAGLLIGLSTHREHIPPMLSLAASFFIFVLLVVLARWSLRKVDSLDAERMNMRRGAAGENAVAMTLATFPDAFYVLNDITTPFGNLDHVVVGPTGVFILDTKNWRGVVTADGKGELLHNGQPTHKREVSKFVSRIMDAKEKIRKVAPGLNLYFQAVFVFTSAWVNAKWKTTGAVHCVRDDQLYDYIVERNFGRKLKAHQTKEIADAFLSLATTDEGFDPRAPIKTPTRNKSPKFATAPMLQPG